MNGLFKTLIKPDWEDNPKRSNVLQAANLLQIGEFQLIQLAYKAWHKEDLPEEKINKIFSEYMLTNIIPIWVTDYANNIIKLDKVKALDIYNDKYHIYDNEFGQFIVDDKQRKKIAKRGKNKYMKYFNSTLVAEYIIKNTFDISYKKNKFMWEGK